MRIIRGASFEEFVRWYLAREGRKRKQNQDLTGRSWESLRAEKRRSEGGKLRPWFEGAHWSIASFDTVAEAMSLVCLDNWQTRRSSLVTGVGSDNRLARTLVAAARETGYFDNYTLMKSNAVERYNRQERIDAFRTNWPLLQDDERLTVCDLNAAEKAENPGGTHYLHDGFGRLLAYLYLVVYEKRRYRPIEVFMCAELQSQAPSGWRLPRGE